MKKWCALSLILVCFLSMTMAGMQPVLHTAESAVVDAGNKFCPLSSDKVSGKDFVTHGGKRYGLCCQMCDKKFLRNPEKYIAEMTMQEASRTTESGEHMH